MDSKPSTDKRISSGIALLPLIVFIAFFLGCGIILSFMGVDKPFNQLPAIVAAYVSTVIAFILYKGTFSEKLGVFLEGVGRKNISIVLIIFILAGAFAGVSKAMGGVDSVVNFCLSFIPHKFIVMGVFFIGCIISFASGSSLGTLATLIPIAIGIVEATGLGIPVVMSAVMSGAVFGNQLSPISDCSIAVTSGMGINVKDKTKYNIVVALPAFIIAIILFMISGMANSSTNITVGEYSLIKIMPYVLVLALSIIGISVIICLSAGILLSGIIGLVYGSFTPISFFTEISNGAVGMGSVIILIIIVSGMAYMVDKMGGINFIVDKLTKVARDSKSAHLSIAALAALTQCCVANDTVTTIITSPLAKEICDKFNVDPRKAGVTITVMAAALAPLLPWSGFTFTAQGLVSQAGYSVSIADTFPLTYYPILLILFAVIFILIPKITAKLFK